MAVGNIKKELATRYGLALYLAAAKRNSLAETRKSAEDLLLILDNRDMSFVVNSPMIAKENKEAALMAIAEKAGFNAEIRNLILVLIQNGRLFAIANILAEFANIVEEKSNNLIVKMISAHEVSDDNKTQIQRTLESKFDRQIKIISEIKPAVIGGIQLKIGSLLIDDSIQGKLQRLKNVMKGV